MRCITLREFREKYLDGTCAACRRTVDEVIHILGLKDDDLVTVITVVCCAMTEGGTCNIPLPCVNKKDNTEMENLLVTIIDQETQKTISGALTEVNNQFCSVSPRLSIKDDILKLVELLDRHDTSLLTVDCTFGCVVKTRVSLPSHVVDEVIEHVTSLAWEIESFFLRHPVTEGNVVPTDYVVVRVRNPNMLIVLHNVAIDNA